MLRPAHVRIAQLVLASLLLLPAMPAGAQSASSQHRLVLDPSSIEWHRSIFENHGWEQPLDACPAYGRGPWPVGYDHNVATFWFGDGYQNCVFETGLWFDLSGVSQYTGAVITQARLTYSDGIAEERDGDGSSVPDPSAINQDAVWESCTARLGVPNDDWRGRAGLIPYTSDESVARLDRTTWDVTEQAQRWYYHPDDENTGLVLVGYDEGTDFSNNAACISGLDNVKLTVDLVSTDPTSTPTPTFLQQVGNGSRVGRGALPASTSTPLVINIEKMRPIAVTPTPTPANLGAISKILPDLTISGVEINGVANTHGVQPTCSVGQPLHFTVHVKNVGVIATTDPAVVSLSVDGTPVATTSVGPLSAGAETSTTMDGIVLGAGTHGYVVTINAAQTIMESDFSNNGFTWYPLVCQ
jgi:hypothetical protein